VNISRRKFSQLSLGAGLSLGEHWLLPQGLSTHKAKPLSRSGPSGRPFNARFVDVAQEAGLRAPVIYGGTEEKNISSRRLDVAALSLTTTTTVGWTFSFCRARAWTAHPRARAIVSIRTTEMALSPMLRKKRDCIRLAGRAAFASATMTTTALTIFSAPVLGKHSVSQQRRWHLHRCDQGRRSLEPCAILGRRLQLCGL